MEEFPRAVVLQSKRQERAFVLSDMPRPNGFVAQQGNEKGHVWSLSVLYRALSTQAAANHAYFYIRSDCRYSRRRIEKKTIVTIVAPYTGQIETIMASQVPSQVKVPSVCTHVISKYQIIYSS